MKAKELFTMVENANKLNELLGDKTMHITISASYFYTQELHTF